MTSIQGHVGSRDGYETLDDDSASLPTVFGLALTIALSVFILGSSILQPGGPANSPQDKIAVEALVSGP
jgi:hypothetical protein